MRSRGSRLLTILVFLVPIAVIATIALWPHADPAEDAGRKSLEKSLAEDEDRQVRGIAARGLGKIGSRDAIDALLAAYQRDETILADVVQSLTELGITPAELHDLAERRRRERASWLFKFRDWILKYDFQSTLFAVTVGAVTMSLVYLLGAILAPAYRRLGFRVAARRGFRGSVGVFVAIMTASLAGWWIAKQTRPGAIDPEATVPDVVIIEIARKAKDLASVPWLMQLLVDPAKPAETRWHAAQALGVIGDIVSLNALQRGTEDSDVRVRLYSDWAIGNLFAPADKKEEELDRAKLDTQQVERIENALRFRPTSAALRLQRARLHMKAREYPAALAELDQAVALSPAIRAEALTDRGWVHAMLGNHAGAIPDYDEAIAADARLKMAWFRRGVAHAALQQWDFALRDLSQAIRLDPAFADAYLQRGHVQRLRNDRPEAARDYRAYLGLAPDALDREMVEKILRNLKANGRYLSPTAPLATTHE